MPSFGRKLTDLMVFPEAPGRTGRSVAFGSLPVAASRGASIDLMVEITASALAGTETRESSRTSVAMKRMPPSSIQEYSRARKPMETARTSPALISPQAVSTRSRSGPDCSMIGSRASNVMPSLVGLSKVTVPTGLSWSCWCRSGIGFLNWTPKGSTMSPTRSGFGVVATPRIIRWSSSTTFTARIEYMRFILGVLISPG